MLKLNPRWSFSTKLSFWIVILAVPVFFASVGYHFRLSHQMIEIEAEEHANGVLNTAMHNIRRYLTSVETVTNIDSWLIENNLNADSLRAFAERIVYLNPYTDACAISTEPGVLPESPDRFFCYSYRQRGDTIVVRSSDTYDYSSKQWYRLPRDRHRPEWVVFYDETNPLKLDKRGMLATYSHPLYGNDGRFVGVVSTGMSLQHISQLLAEEKPYPHSYFILIDELGRFVGHPDSTLLFSETMFSIANPRKQADLIALGYEMTKGKQGRMSVVIDGAPSLVCFKPVPGTTWSLGIVCPNSDILHDYNRFYFVVISLLISGLLIIVLYCHRMVRRSFRPLMSLLSKTQEIASGNMDVTVARSQRIDNIGCLQNSYVSMLEALRHYMDSVRTASQEAQRYNEELERTTQLVVEADRQKTAFIQNMTHQVRTPLNIIMGYAQVLNTPGMSLTADNGISEEEIKSLASTMDHNSKQLNRLVLMLFDCSDVGMTETAQCQKHERLEVNATVREAMDYIRSVSPDVPIGFETDVPDDFVISTNKKFLQYSLGELLLNAIKYSDRQHIMMRISLTDFTIRFIVEDTGPGIPEADRELLFDFFTKVDDFSEGLGLGLPLTKRHASNLGGNFYLDSTYEKGCRFVFELPL